MNGRWLGLLTFFIITILFVTACQSNDAEEYSNVNISTNETGTAEVVDEDAVRITISMNNGHQFLNETEIPFEENKNLLHLLKQNFFVEEKDGVITSIERMQINKEEQTEWVLFVNEEKQDVNPTDYVVQPGDKIQLDLQSN